MAIETTFANEQETLQHMELLYSVYGTELLLSWETADGKWINSVVLDNLADEGVIRRVDPKSVNMWTSPKYYFIP